jgi:hypothetical protein
MTSRDDAKEIVLYETGLTEDEYVKNPILKFYSRQIEAILENRKGYEGETSRTEGDLTRSFTTELIPKEIKMELAKYKKNKARRF